MFTHYWYRTQEEDNIEAAEDQIKNEDEDDVGEGDEASLTSNDENPQGEEGNESDTTFYSVTSRYDIAVQVRPYLHLPNPKV